MSLSKAISLNIMLNSNTNDICRLSIFSERESSNSFLSYLIGELINVGADLYEINEYKMSYNYFEEALKIITCLESSASISPESTYQDIRKMIGTGKKKLNELISLSPSPLNMYEQRNRYPISSLSLNKPVKIERKEKNLCEALLLKVIILINAGIVRLRQNMPKDAVDKLLVAKNIMTNEKINNPKVFMILGNCLACAKLSQGLIHEALALFTATKSISHEKSSFQKELGSEELNESLGLIASNMGRIHFVRKEYEKAITCCWESFRCLREARSDEDIEVCVAMYNLGLIKQKQENFVEAIEFFQFFLNRACHSTKGEEIPNRDVVTVLSNVLIIHCKKFTFSHKNTELQSSLKNLQHSRNELGVENPEIPVLLNLVASNLFELALHQYALPFFYEKLRVEKIFLGGTHPELAFTLNCIGQCLRCQQCYSEALTNFSQALNLLRNEATSSIYAQTLYNIGMAHHQLGEHDEAMTCLAQALEKQINAVGEYHPNVAEMYHNIGGIELDQGRIECALNNLMRALLIKRMIFGNDHHLVSETLYKIAQLHDVKGEYVEALNVYEETLRIEQANLGEVNIDVAITLRHMGQIYHSIGDFHNCSSAYIKVIYILQEHVGEYHQVVASMYNDLASVCLENGRSKEATTFYNESQQIIKKIEETSKQNYLQNNFYEEVEEDYEFERKIIAVFGGTGQQFLPIAAASA